MPVYFIQAGEDGPVKIGVANDVPDRLRALQTAHWLTLHIRHVFDGGVSKERAFHERYKAHWIAGEWHAAAVLQDVSDIPVSEVEPVQSLQAFLLDNGLTAVAFAALIAVEPPTVIRYLRGDRIPKPDIMRRIVTATGGLVRPEAFYGSGGDAVSIPVHAPMMAAQT